MDFALHSMAIQRPSQLDGTSTIVGMETGCPALVMSPWPLSNAAGTKEVREYET